MFDYNAFAEKMSSQAKEITPPELSDKEKNYIATTISDFIKTAGGDLNSDDKSDINSSVPCIFG